MSTYKAVGLALNLPDRSLSITMWMLCGIAKASARATICTRKTVTLVGEYRVQPWIVVHIPGEIQKLEGTKHPDAAPDT